MQRWMWHSDFKELTGLLCAKSNKTCNIKVQITGYAVSLKNHNSFLKSSDTFLECWFIPLFLCLWKKFDFIKLIKILTKIWLNVVCNMKTQSKVCFFLINSLSNFGFILKGREDEKRSEENPSFGYPKTCQECWQTEVKKVSHLK